MTAFKSELSTEVVVNSIKYLPERLMCSRCYNKYNMKRYNPCPPEIQHLMEETSKHRSNSHIRNPGIKAVTEGATKCCGRTGKD